MPHLRVRAVALLGAAAMVVSLSSAPVAGQPPPPQASIADASGGEGDPSDEFPGLSFTVTLDQPPSSFGASVDYRTVEGTATGIADSEAGDYFEQEGELFFEEGQTTAGAFIFFSADDVWEDDEDFTVELFNPNGLTIDDGSGEMTIIDDDEPSDLPDLDVSDASVVEGTGGPDTCLDVEVTLEDDAEVEATVDWSLEDGTADETDYRADDGTASIDPGDDSTTIPVCIVPDADPEPEESFFVELENADDAELTDDRAQITILDDDEGAPQITIDDDVILEGDPDEPASCAPVAVGLTAPAAAEVTVDYATVDGSALAGSDYTTATGSVSFAVGDTSRTVEVCAVNDLVAEDGESFTIELSDARNAGVLRDAATVQIVDDESRILGSFTGNARTWRLTDFDDDLTIVGDNNVIVAGGGNDRLVIIGCGNRILGEAGNDVVRVSGCVNRVLAGGGNDTVTGTKPPATSATKAGRRLLQQGGGLSILGQAGNDIVKAAQAADRLSGGNGRDQLVGKGGRDRLKGGRGPDVLKGGPANDVLIGGAGFDQCSGGPGRDRLRGCNRVGRRAHG